MKKDQLKAIREELVLLRTGILNPCSDYDPFGLCPCTDCFLCENCDYMIIDSEGNILKDFSSLDLTSEFEDRKIYKVEFFDEGYFKQFEKYMTDYDSDYRLTRIFSESNGDETTIMKFSKLDQKKIREEEKEREQHWLMSSIISKNSYQEKQIIPTEEVHTANLPVKVKKFVKSIFQGFKKFNN